MPRAPIVIVAAIVVGAVAVGGLVAVRLHSSQPQWQVVDRYCMGCHNEIDVAGGLAFENVDRADVAENAAVWEAVVRKLRTGLMPPKGEPRPERACSMAWPSSSKASSTQLRHTRRTPARNRSRA